MKKQIRLVLHIIVLAIPVAAWIWAVAPVKQTQARLEKFLMSPTEVRWGDGADQLAVQVDRRAVVEEESLYLTIQVMRSDGTPAYHREVVVNADLGGNGFVKGMQADGDADFEVVVWGTGLYSGEFYLDFVNGEVLEIPLKQASAKTLEITREWRRSGQTNVFAAGIAALLTLVIYGTYAIGGIVVGLGWLRKMIRRNNSRQSQEETKGRPEKSPKKPEGRE